MWLYFEPQSSESATSFFYIHTKCTQKTNSSPPQKKPKLNPTTLKMVTRPSKQFIFRLTGFISRSFYCLVTRKKAWRRPCRTPSRCTPASSMTFPRWLPGWRASWSRWGAACRRSASATASCSTPRWGWSERSGRTDGCWSEKRAGEASKFTLYCFLLLTEERRSWALQHKGNKKTVSLFFSGTNYQTTCAALDQIKALSTWTPE